MNPRLEAMQAATRETDDYRKALDAIIAIEKAEADLITLKRLTRFLRESTAGQLASIDRMMQRLDGTRGA